GRPLPVSMRRVESVCADEHQPTNPNCSHGSNFRAVDHPRSIALLFAASHISVRHVAGRLLPRPSTDLGRSTTNDDVCSWHLHGAARIFVSTAGRRSVSTAAAKLCLSTSGGPTAYRASSAARRSDARNIRRYFAGRAFVSRLSAAD